MRKLKQASIDRIAEIVETHKGKKGPIKLMLHDIQNEMG